MSTSMSTTGEPAAVAPAWCTLSVVPDGPEPLPAATGDVLATLLRAAIGAHPHDLVASERFVRIRNRTTSWRPAGRPGGGGPVVAADHLGGNAGTAE